MPGGQTAVGVGLIRDEKHAAAEKSRKMAESRSAIARVAEKLVRAFRNERVGETFVQRCDRAS